MSYRLLRLTLIREKGSKTELEKHCGEVKTKTPSPFAGYWRIVSMSAWEQDFIDEEEEGYVEFGGKDQGQFHFGYVHGQMDCMLTTRDGEPAMEWTWVGNDEMEPAQGRGWAVVMGDELHGMIFFHGGDDSEFVARKRDKPASKPKKP